MLISRAGSALKNIQEDHFQGRDLGPMWWFWARSADRPNKTHPVFRRTRITV